MTPKFDNLASLLMEMPPTRRVDYDEVAAYIKEFPEATFEEIATKFGVSSSLVSKIAKNFDIHRRPQGTSTGLDKFHKGKETHHVRKLTDKQEKQVLDHWLGNHHEMTFQELTRWIKQQFNVGLSRTHVAILLKRAAGKHNKRLPLSDRGKGMRLRRQRSQHRNEPGTGKLPTQGSQQFSGSDQIVPSNPKHGGPAHPPK